MPEIVQEIGAYAGLASVLGLAVLSALYFSQARDVKRLREWAGRAPERTTDPSQPITAARMTPQPEARVPRSPAPQPVKSGAPPVPAAAGARPASAAGPATAAAGGASAAAPAGGNSGAQGAPGNSVASPPQQPGTAPDPPAGEETKEVARSQSATGVQTTPPQRSAAAPSAPARPPLPDRPAAPGKASGPAQPAVPGQTPGATPPGAPATAAANRPPARPGVSQHTAVIAPPKPPWHERLFGSTRNLALTVAGVVVLGAGVAFLLTQTSEDEPTSATQQDGGGQAPAGAEPGDAGDGGQGQGEGRRARNRPAIDPSSVTVAVLNGTTVPGLAQSLGDRVTELGFNLGTVANSEDDEGQQRAESVILFAAGHEREAVVVSRRLDIAQREEIDPTTQGLAGDATVVVIAGADRQ